MTERRVLLTTFLSLLVIRTSAFSAEGTRPNVLFLIVDDMTTTLSCQRWPGAKTPHLDALAARGVRFERAYCQFAICNPARASFLTGCYPEKTKVMNLEASFRDALPDVVTLPQHFKNHGYRTAAVGKVFHVPDPKTQHDILHRSPLALDQNILHDAKQRDPTDPPRKTGKGQDYNRNYAAADRPDSDFTDYQIAGRAIESLAQLKDGPFFMTVGFIRPHTPFVAPRWAFEAIDRPGSSSRHSTPTPAKTSRSSRSRPCVPTTTSSASSRPRGNRRSRPSTPTSPPCISWIIKSAACWPNSTASA